MVILDKFYIHFKIICPTWREILASTRAGSNDADIYNQQYLLKILHHGSIACRDRSTLNPPT